MFFVWAIEEHLTGHSAQLVSPHSSFLRLVERKLKKKKYVKYDILLKL